MTTDCDRYGDTNLSDPIPNIGGWWTDWRYLASLVALGAIPLLWPPLPPLVDALGHLSRYHIETAIAGSPALQRYYSFDWKLIGNLGVDLLIVPLSAVIGVEAALKVIVLTIPVLTAAGLVLVSRAIHGRVTPFVAFALPLAYGFPFQFGFLNSCMATGLALLAFAAWISLGKRERKQLRAALFVVVGLLLWICHVVGWAELGIMVAAYEWSQARSRGQSWWTAAWTAVSSTIPLWPPIALMLVWRHGGAAGATAGWFNFSDKLTWLTDVFRDRWKNFDRASAALVTLVIVAGAVYRRVGFARDLGWVTLGLVLVFLALPFKLLGSDLADMRLAPLVFACGLLALKAPHNPRWGSAIAASALLFFLVRTAVVTFDFADNARGYREQLVALDYVPRGSRVLVFAATPCSDDWADGRVEHLGGMAIVRRDAFTNDQFALDGAQLLSIHYPAAGTFQKDPSQFIRTGACKSASEPIDERLIPVFPASAFDYVWLIGFPGADALRHPDLIRLWGRPNGALYRIVHARPAEGSPAERTSANPGQS